MISENDLNYKAQLLRKKLGVDPVSPIDIFSIVHQIKDLTIIINPMGKNISGMCYKDISLIAINSDHSYGRCRFTLAHELYHYYYDDSSVKIVCINQSFDSKPLNERLADLFASYFLAPYDAFRMMIEGITKDNINEKNIIEIEQYFGMSRLATLFRLKKEGLIDSSSWDKYNSYIISTALSYGYEDKLYRKFSDKPITYGKYISFVNELYKDERITTGKKNELLVDAFRSDMVYGEFDEEFTEID